MSFEHIPVELILFFILYGVVAVACLIGCVYLLLRRSNAFARDITPPLSLRRWAAAFCGVVALGHMWWYFFYVFSDDPHSFSYLVVAMLDYVGLLTTIAGTLLAMLQDRRRSVWPIVIAMIPVVVIGVLYVRHPDDHYLDVATAYFLLVYVLFTIYMLFAVREYGRWLRDNYADLEHKEVWMNQALAIILLLSIITYGFDGDNMTISFFVQFMALVLVGLLLWRVETLQCLSLTPGLSPRGGGSYYLGRRRRRVSGGNGNRRVDVGTETFAHIEQLLAERCVGTQLYLQHDLTLMQLVQAVGTNHFYLSQYFASLGTTYNAYINDLRINHFMRLYHETVEAGRPVALQQLASASGYRSYSTFSLAFKQRFGKNVKAWMRETAR